MAGAHQGFFEAHALRAQMVHVVEHQDAVLRHDADADDGAEKGHDVQRRAGDPQRQHGAEQRQHRAEDDGHRFVERAELDQQHREDQQDGHDQDEHEIAKGFLLLLVKAAEFDRARRQRFVRAQLCADFGHRAAEVAAFQSRGDANILPQVFASQFELARLFDHVGDLRQFHRHAGW